MEKRALVHLVSAVRASDIKIQSRPQICCGLQGSIMYEGISKISTNEGLGATWGLLPQVTNLPHRAKPALPP